MKKKIPVFPGVMTFLSAVYFFYVLSSKDTILAADAVGGDPGGKVLPMFMAVFMFLGFLYLTLTETAESKKMDKTTRNLFLITLGLSVLYVLAIRQVGFIILTSLLMYALEYIFATIDEPGKPLEAVLGGVGTIALTVGVYAVMRTLTRTLLRLGRAGTLPGIFASTSFEALISLVFVALVVAALHFTVCRLLKAKGRNTIATSGLLTLATVLFLFVVFKQFFAANLAQGILKF